MIFYLKQIVFAKGVLMQEFYPWIVGIAGTAITILLTVVGTLLVMDRADMKEAIKSIGTGLEALAKEFREDIRRVHERIDKNSEEISNLNGRCDAINGTGKNCD